MSDLNQKLIGKQQANNMTFDQMTLKITQQLSSITQKNQTLMKKAESEYDAQFLKNFDIFKKQIQSEISDTQETIKILVNKAKNQPQKMQAKKYSDQISQEFDRYKNSVKKIVNNSFAQKQENLRKSSVLNNSRSIDSDEGTIDQSGRNDSRFGNKNQQQQQQQAQQRQYNDFIDYENQLNRERQEELNKLEKDTEGIYNNFQKIAELNNQQGIMVDVIDDTTFQTQQQVKAAKQEMVQADKHQSSAKRKYIIFALIILIALGVTLAIVFTQM
ncbi:transmembrane protein, putative (macronuclear) [Tetrahymena thermophila SB210]|uniref:Transmembrane protein, putative n=1 Tax=Tetrahymena thermophila (strain SB210) TaxID=312017 RepID=I7LX05_TETTS|nr:transmembrane protein, putative [Tetrahymena thermophila SB210]EAS03205.1 transmembrane protein, putative [Tetrahymena thermophila SB210]|eukprot:XP_001023450.1 transmembrane protein, putative [Tetrahymena thermophila SB210]